MLCNVHVIYIYKDMVYVTYLTYNIYNVNKM